MFSVGDLVKIMDDYRVYLIVESNPDNQKCIIRYIHSKPKQGKEREVDYSSLEFIDHLKIEG